jgi:hypothetical protein
MIITMFYDQAGSSKQDNIVAWSTEEDSDTKEEEEASDLKSATSILGCIYMGPHKCRQSA